MEGFPLSMAVAPISLKTWQATCGISTRTFITLYRPYQARSHFLMYHRSIGSGLGISRYSKSNDLDSDWGAKKPDRDILS